MDSHLHHTSTQEAPSHLHDVATPPPADDLDDLFNYDARVDDVFRQVDTDMNVPSNEGSRPGNRGTETGAGLGIDEEIKISRKRRPAVKLDVERYGNVQICDVLLR